ncbi:MAG: hypothetical protein IKE63_03495 [Bacilli bacterium]|nr:hypothetical protein [Bacilli bacterium]
MNKKYSMILGAAIMSVFAIVIAYAALSATLTITTNKITQNALTWNVGFTTGTVNATAVGTSATGRTCGSATVAATSITVADTTLSKPGDGCIWKFTVKNTGGIAAKLSSIVPAEPSSTSCTKTNASSSAGAQMVCGNLTYSINSAASNSSGTTITKTGLTTGSTLAASTGSLDVYLVVQYTGTGLNGSAVTQSGGKFTFTYEQA